MGPGPLLTSGEDGERANRGYPLSFIEPTFRTSSGPQGVLMAYAEAFRDLDVIEIIEVIER